MSSADNSTIAKNDKNLRLLVVSNRLPVTVNKDKESGEYNFKMSSGGLVAALSGLKKMMSFTWIGWPGKLLFLWLHETQRIQKKKKSEKIEGEIMLT